VNLPFRVGTLLEPNPECPPGTGEPSIDSGLLGTEPVTGEPQEPGFP
jgi:hypothetical protein